MNIDEYCEIFSNKSYATKQEVAKALHIGSNIDGFWNNILAYRSNFARKLNLRDIERTPFNIVLTPLILNNVNSIERKLSKLMIRYEKLGPNDVARFSLRNNNMIKSLRHIANKYNISIEDNVLTSMVNGDFSPSLPNQISIKNYYDALKEIEKYYADPINENTFYKFASILSGINSFDDLYRKEEIEDRNSRLVIDRVYSAAPLERIQQMINDLLEFINDETYSSVIRAIVSYFYLIMMKPFNYFSEEIAILVAKSILAHNDFDEVGILLDLETLIDDLSEEQGQLIKEVLRSNDVTYIVNKIIELLIPSIDEMLSYLAKNNAQDIMQEFFKGEDNQKEIKEENTQKINETLVNDEKVLHNVDYEVRVALPKFPIGLDEKDANYIAEHLLELNPNLKKGEAMFYAHHCTVGKYYTIQQFKTVNECAYETARTSMDHLASEGYYRKEMIKNKFVYTPIPRK